MATKVMYSFRQCQCLLQTLSIRHNLVKQINAKVTQTHSASWNHYSTSPEGDTTEHSTSQEGDTTEQTVEEQDDLDELHEVEQKRDVARLPLWMKNKLEHSLQHTYRPLFIKNEVRFERKLYSYYGRACGVDPNVAWPTREQLQEEIDFEQEFIPSLQERWAALSAKEEEVAVRQKEKEEHVAKQMGKMPDYIAQYRARLAKVDAAEKAQAAKRTALMEEARDHFGFAMDPRDPRFIDMQEKKAEQESMRRKKLKKEEKSLRTAASLKKIHDDAIATKTKG